MVKGLLRGDSILIPASQFIVPREHLIIFLPIQFHPFHLSLSKGLLKPAIRWIVSHSTELRDLSFPVSPYEVINSVPDLIKIFPTHSISCNGFHVFRVPMKPKTHLDPWKPANRRTFEKTSTDSLKLDELLNFFFAIRKSIGRYLPGNHPGILVASTNGRGPKGEGHPRTGMTIVGRNLQPFDMHGPSMRSISEGLGGISNSVGYELPQPFSLSDVNDELLSSFKISPSYLLRYQSFF